VLDLIPRVGGLEALDSDSMTQSSRRQVMADPGRGDFTVRLYGEHYRDTMSLLGTFPEFAHDLLEIFGVIARGIGASFAMALSDLVIEDLYTNRSGMISPSHGRSWFRSLVNRSEGTFFVDDELMGSLGHANSLVWSSNIKSMSGGGHLLWDDTPFEQPFMYDRIAQTRPYKEFVEIVADRVYRGSGLEYR